MFHIISKLFTFLLMPLGISMFLVFCMIISKNRTKARRLGILTLLLTYFFSCPFLVNKLTMAWEPRQRDINEIPSADVGVLLTGGLIKADLKYPSNLHLNSSGDRLWQTLHLYQSKKVEHILITGGDISLLKNRSKTEIDFALEYLLKNGVPGEKILLDFDARNTHENAINSAKIIENEADIQSAILITSAYHMRRSLACFEKEGITPVPFSTDFIQAKRKLDILDFIPSANTYYDTSIIFKEISGFVIYKIMGYC